MGCRPRVPKYRFCQKGQSVIHGIQRWNITVTGELLREISVFLYFLGGVC